MAKFKNALHKLGIILEPDSGLALRETHDKIVKNEIVRGEGLFFQIPALVEFLMSFHLGMAYASAKYPGSIPKDIMLYANPTENGTPMEWLCCRVSHDRSVDEISIAHICVARYCHMIEHGSMGRACDHLPEGHCASGRVAAICHAVEECHHYYWTMVLGNEGCPKQGDREHPMERAAREAIAVAITDLCLPLRPLK